jgi:hypothetical protein
MTNTKIIVDDSQVIPLSDAIESFESGESQCIWFIENSKDIMILIPFGVSETYGFVNLNDILYKLTRFGFSAETNSADMMFLSPTAKETIEHAVRLKYTVFVSPTTDDFFESVGLYLNGNKQ